MQLRSVVVVLLAGLGATPGAAGSPPDGDRLIAVGGSGPGAADRSRPTCITPDERAAIVKILRAADATLPTPLGVGAEQAGRSTGPRFRFYPIGGQIYGDLNMNNYTDLSGPAPGVIDWSCGNHTYDGHRGHDVDLRSFEEQLIGVPIFAALPGVVVGRDDGHFDQNTAWEEQPANYVILDHSEIEPGFRTFYWHMRSGSVLPALGERVAAGQQIGLVGSSGNSTGPHLHFEVWRNGSWVESMVGTCRPGDSMWADQWSKPVGHSLRDFGFFAEGFAPGWDRPDPFPRDRAVPLDHGFVTYWMMGRNMPRDTLYRFRFFAPDGRLDFDSGQRLLNFTTDGPLHRYWAYFTWNVTDMKQEPGDWRVEIEFNNERIHDATVRVLADGQTPGNTPPVPPIIEFDPPNPGPEDVTFVRVRTDLVDDDAEYDLVRYRYRWQIDGLTIRDTVSAGGADAIPSLADLGLDSTPPRMISVEVTPNDGTIDGQTATLAVLVDDGGCLADVNDDGLATSADFFAWVSAFGTQAPECDVNNDNACTSADFFAWVSAFSQGC